MFRTRISRLLDQIARIGEEVDDPDLRTQKIAMLLFVIISIPQWIIIGTIELLSGPESFLLYFAVGSFILILLTFLIYIQGGNFTSFRARMLAITLPLPIFFHILQGGFAGSTNLMFSLIAPLMALLSSKPREARPWFLGSIGFVIVAIILEPMLFPERNLSAKDAFVDFGTNILIALFMTYFLVVHFVNQKNQAFAALGKEQERSENLLLNVLPKEIVPVLKSGQSIIADQFDAASVLFADIVGFTPLSLKMEPSEMVRLLNEIFSNFDSMVEKYGLEKIRTIGDNYMVASGVPRPRSDHALVLANMALDMMEYCNQIPSQNGHSIEFRIGINSGPIVAGVIGHKKFQYDLWGDTVNTASRMESHGVAGKIQVTQESYELLQKEFILEPRGGLDVKGKGKMETWFLVGRHE